MMETENEILASFTKAIGHPMRVEILRILMKQESCYCGDIVEELPLAQSTVSQHLKELKKSGLIKGTVSGKNVCYCIDFEKVNEFKTLLSTIFDINIDSENKCC